MKTEMFMLKLSEICNCRTSVFVCNYTMLFY